MQREYKISISQEYYSDVVYVSQYDSDYNIVFTVMDKYSKADVDGYTAYFKGLRTDGLGFTFSATGDGNTVTFAIDTTMTAVSGTHTGEVIFYDDNGLYFGSANVQIIVEPAAQPDGTIDADVQTAQTIQQEVQAIVDTAAATVTASVTELEGEVDTNTANIATNTTAIGTLTNLTTDAQTNLVSAINEVDAHADTNADAISSLNADLNAIETLQNDTNKIINVLTAQNKTFTTGLNMNSSSGGIGTTENLRYYGIAVGTDNLDISEYISFVIKCDTTHTAKIYVSFFDSTKTTLVGSVTIINPALATNNIEIPTGAAYANIAGYSTGNSHNQSACDTTYVYAVVSIFEGNLDDELTSDILPAQGKATGDRITALENLNSTTGVSRLRLNVNDYNIPFVVKTGQTNLFLGYGAGGDNTEDWEGDTEQSRDNGHYNVGVGFEALNRNEDGDHCTAVGYTCLKFNQTGDFNTAVGEDALYANTAGSNNIAMGDHAGQNNQGDDNILIGARVMRPATNAHRNIVIGKEAGSVLDEGADNILIGNGVNPDTDASGEIIIGSATQTSVKIAGKTINFNADGTVTWS